MNGRIISYVVALAFIGQGIHFMISAEGVARRNIRGGRAFGYRFSEKNAIFVNRYVAGPLAICLGVCIIIITWLRIM
jgi:hypothetical protein